jgi:Zn-dependent protease with chaperone function
MINGRYFDGLSAASTPATLEFSADRRVLVHGTAQPVAVPLDQVGISDRIANITRRLSFPDGAVFETGDNDAVDRACEAAGLAPRAGLVHWLESRWPVSVAALIGVVLLSIGFLRWGVPAIANWAAEVVPAEMDVAIGNGTLEALDQIVFYETGLPDERQRELTTKFAAMTSGLNDGHRYELVLRNGGALGANALALPSGIVVMTDQLVTLAQTDDELVAVLAHEIGHVRGRHALRHLLQAAGVSAIAMALLGDVSSVSGLLPAAPALLHAKHSREFESEADGFAKRWLRDNGIAESHFDAILCRMSGSSGETRSFDFFATHPPTHERARCGDDPAP